MTRGRQRANGGGSIFPYRNGYAAYVWVTTPDGKRRRKWAYGKTRQDVHGKWLKLHDATRRGPVHTSTPTLAEYMAHWLREVVIPPNYAPLTCATYETLTGCTCCLASAPSGSTSSPCAMCAVGSTS